MTPLEHIKKRIYPYLLKPMGFSNTGKVWFKELKNGIVLFVGYNAKTVKSDDFSFSVAYGIYFNGVHELLYNNPFDYKYGLENSIIKTSGNPKRVKSHFFFTDVTMLEELEIFVKRKVMEEAIPFFESFLVPLDVCDFLESRIEIYKKSDSIAILKLACIYFLIDQNEQACSLITSVIEDSKEKYVFAENLFDRINCKG